MSNSAINRGQRLIEAKLAHLTGFRMELTIHVEDFADMRKNIAGLEKHDGEFEVGKQLSQPSSDAKDLNIKRMRQKLKEYEDEVNAAKKNIQFYKAAIQALCEKNGIAVPEKIEGGKIPDEDKIDEKGQEPQEELKDK